MHQDLKQIIKEDVFQSQFQLQLLPKLLQLLMFAHQVLNQTELEIVLQHQSQLFVQLDSAVMEMETVFLTQFLFLTHAHPDKPVMGTETVSLHHFQLHANMDLKQILKETVFQFSHFHLHQQLHSHYQ